MRNEEGLLVMKPLHLTAGQAHMPRIGYGTAAIQGRTEELVCTALKAGFRMFDTAQAREWYREDLLGEALQDCYFKDMGDPGDIMVRNPSSTLLFYFLFLLVLTSFIQCCMDFNRLSQKYILVTMSAGDSWLASSSQ